MDSIIKVTGLEEEEKTKERSQELDSLVSAKQLASVDLVYLANPVPGFFFFLGFWS